MMLIQCEIHWLEILTAYLYFFDGGVKIDSEPSILCCHQDSFAEMRLQAWMLSPKNCKLIASQSFASFEALARTWDTVSTLDLNLRKQRSERQKVCDECQQRV